MNIAILGTGAIGLGYAAVLSSKGHCVSAWSPSGAGTVGLRENGGMLTASGKIEGSFRVSVGNTLGDVVSNARMIIFAIPGYGHEAVMRAAAPYVSADQILVVTPIVSLSAYVLASILSELGVAPLICASPTTVLTARKLNATGVNVLTLRREVDLSCYPGRQIDHGLQTMRELFGDVFTSQPSLLASSLSNINPVVHVPLALMNMSRIERGEKWLQYEQLTEHVSSVIDSLDRERVLLGQALGFRLGSIEAHFRRSFGTGPGTLAEIAGEIVRSRNGGPEGPTSTETRFLHEDVPFGLGFYSFIGRLIGVPTQAMDACITLANASLREDLVGRNGFLSALAQDVACKADLLAVTA